MSDEPVQCPECNRWSDRGEGEKYVQLAKTADEAYNSDKAYYACLAPDCAAYMFKAGANSAFGLLAVDNFDEPVAQVKREKLEDYDRVDLSVI